MAEQLSMFESSKRKSGLLYLPKYLMIADQKDLLNDLRSVVRQSPLFTPTMSSGAPFRYKMTNIGDLGWNSDRQGYRYESRHPVTGQPYPEIPSSLRSMIDDLSGKFGEKIRPDAVLLNWYSNGAKLGLHVDNTEKVSKPVVSISLGDRGVFAIDTTGSRDRNTAMKNLERINVNSGDAIVFGGDLRNAYHAVERIDAGTAPPELGMKSSGRINLTARQVNKISGESFGNSVSKLAKGFAMREGARFLAKQLGADEQQQQAVADTATVVNVAASLADNSRVNNMAANKKINIGSLSASVKEAKPQKLTTDTLYKYLQMMGGEPVIVKPDGKQATKGKFAFGQDIGLNNEFTKLPEIHVRFDDPKISSLVARELATGELTVGMQRNPQTGEIETTTKKFEPIPSRGNTQMRGYRLGNDPTGDYLAFNKPEEAYKAPKSLKELQADLRKSYQIFDLKPDASIADLEAAVQPRLNEFKSNPDLRDRLQTVLSDMQNRNVLVEPTRSPDPVPVQQSKPSKTQLSLEGDRIGGYEPKHVPKILEALNNEDTYRAVLGSMSVADQERFNSGLEALQDGNKFGNRDLLDTLNRARRDVPRLGGDMYTNDARQAFSQLDDALGVKFGFNKTLKFGLNDFKNSAKTSYRVDIPDQAKIELVRAKIDGVDAFKVANIVAYNPENVGDRFAMKTLKFLQENLPKPVVMGNVINEKFARIFEKQGYTRRGNDFLPPNFPVKEKLDLSGFVPDSMGDRALQQIQNHAITPDAQTRLNTALSAEQILDTPSDAWKFPQRNERSLPNFYPQMASGDNPLGTGATVQSTYERAKSAYQGYQDFGYAPSDRQFPTFREMTKLAESEGVKGDEAIKAYIKGKQNAPLIESGVITPPELPLTARLGQEYISPKTGKVGTVESVGKKGVKLNVDGQVVPLEYQTLEKLKYTGNKGYGFSTPAALRPAIGAIAGGTLGAIAFKQLAKAAGLNEDQQNIAAGVGGVTGALTGGSLSLFKPTTELKAPTAQQFARNVMGIPAPSESGMFLTSEGRNKMRLNQLNQYDVKPVLGEAAVIATDLLTPHPYGIATVPAARMATDSWKNNYDAIAERGLAAMKTTATGATSAIKDFTYQTLSQLGRSAGLPFPMTEQSVGQVLDAIPNAQQVMSMADRAKARLSRRASSESGMVMMGDRQSTGAIFEAHPKSLSELQKQRAKLDIYNPDAKPIQAVKEFKPVPKLSLEEAAAMQGMKPNEYKGFQEKVYAETDYLNSKPYQEVSERIAQQRFNQQQPYFDALKAWNKAGDPSVPMPRKEDFAQSMKRTFDMQATLSEASMRAKKATTSGFGKTQPKQSNFIAESTVEAAAKSSGATTAQVKAQIANQRASGNAPDLSKATEAIAQTKQSKELATRTQSKELSTKVLSRQQPDNMIATPSQGMINAGSKPKLGDRIGQVLNKEYSHIGLAPFMDTAQAANALTESASRGENAPIALTRAGLSVTAGYATTAATSFITPTALANLGITGRAASFISNPYVKTALVIGGGLAAVTGADKAIDQVVGRNEAKEQKYAKDLSKLDLQPTNEAEQWKPFSNDSSLLGAYGNSFTAQIQSNLDYRPAARSLANLANSQSIENARYQSERQTSVQAGMDAKSKKSIAFEDRGNGVTVGYNRDRGYNATESRVLALQNLANEHGYETPRTGKFESKTLDALEKLGYSQKQISDFIQGQTKVIGEPTAKPVKFARSKFGGSKPAPVTGSELSAALSAERKAQGLTGGQMLNQGQVDQVFSSLAGRSLTQLRQSTKVGGNKTQSALRLGAGIK